eukprot:2142073-Prorocentrum_lima.AAC.1
MGPRHTSFMCTCVGGEEPSPYNGRFCVFPPSAEPHAHAGVLKLFTPASAYAELPFRERISRG